MDRAISAFVSAGLLLLLAGAFFFGLRPPSPGAAYTTLLNADKVSPASDTPAGRCISRLVAGDTLAEFEGGTLRYAHLDHLGSRMALTGIDGAPTSQFSHLPFGVPLGVLTRDADFTGKRPEFTTPFTDFGLRQYLPGIGRFLAADPLLRSGASLYAYVANRPLGATDPVGADERTAFTPVVRDNTRAPEVDFYEILEGMFTFSLETSYMEGSPGAPTNAQIMALRSQLAGFLGNLPWRELGLSRHGPEVVVELLGTGKNTDDLGFLAGPGRIFVDYHALLPDSSSLDPLKQAIGPSGLSLRGQLLLMHEIMHHNDVPAWELEDKPLRLGSFEAYRRRANLRYAHDLIRETKARAGERRFLDLTLTQNNIDVEERRSLLAEFDTRNRAYFESRRQGWQQDLLIIDEATQRGDMQALRDRYPFGP